MPSPQKKIQHLFLRAAFGELPVRINDLANKRIEDVVEELFNDSKECKDINYLPYPLTEDREKMGVGGFQLVKMILKSKKDTEELNAEWIFKMIHTKAVLREKMTFFWHNHFATSTSFAYLMQEQNNTIRKHALGRFSDLLMAVAKDPAMILYLNNQQNKKNHPNENFAREVMELFTLGIGNYSEKDVKEAARAFTGWTVNAHGEFEFHPNQHDDGEKEFIGKKGYFNGEEIIKILSETKETSLFISSKIYKEFVNPVVNTRRIEEMADIFYNSGLDVGVLMRHIYTSEWFYEDENIGAKISSPVELIVRYGKLLNVEFKEEKTLLNLQKALGQVLFFPPNVAGWKGGTNWIDSTSLLLRLSIPRFILNGGELSLKAKPEFEAMDVEDEEKTKDEKIHADWSVIINATSEIPEEKISDFLLEYLLQIGIQDKEKILFQTENVSSKEKKIRSIASAIMSLPEFQMI